MPSRCCWGCQPARKCCSCGFSTNEKTLELRRVPSFEIPNDPRIRIVEPKMATYLRVSMEITRLLHRYVPKEAIHVYSVDESFIKVDGTKHLWGMFIQSQKNSR